MAAVVFAASGEVRYFLTRKKLCSTFELMPRGWISRLKKYHDLQICTRTTCLGILGNGIRKKKNSNRKCFFSNLQTSKYRLLKKKIEMHENVPRLDISLTKNHTTFKFAHDLPVAVFLAMGFAKKIHTGSDNLLNSALFFWTNINGVYKFEKNTSGWKIFFLRKPSPRILRHVGRVQI